MCGFMCGAAAPARDCRQSARKWPLPLPLPLEPDFMCGQPPKPTLSAARRVPEKPIPYFLSSPQTTLIPPNSKFPSQIYFPIPFRFTPPNLIK